MSLKHGILGLLLQQERTGYDLKKDFNGSIAHLWNGSMSQIYRDLKTLEHEGAVVARIHEQQEKPDKKIYSITPLGRKMFQDWLEEFPKQTSPLKRDAFQLRLFFGAHLPEDKIIHELQRFQDEKRQYLAFIETMSQQLENRLGMDTSQRYLRFTLKRAQLSLKALMEWSQWCLDEMGV
ncbi:MAG: PadR family transcriptional regulator [Spirochaetales bacterium]|nr:PadR family transcriptional regulator [Spirochaetales bacterium]